MIITIEGVSNVEKALSKLANIEEIVYGWMKSGETDDIMQASFGTNFNKQGRPKWKGLTTKTKENRNRDGFASGPILFRTGNMRDEVTSVNSDVTKQGNMVVASWGADKLRGIEKTKFSVHQSGSTEKGIPARPMMMFNEKDGPKLLRSFTDFLAKQI